LINYIQANDRDGDGLSDQLETLIGSDPDNADSDNDGIYDGDEFDAGTLSTGNGVTIVGGNGRDTDKDGLSDEQEVALGTI
jgi:hypothetical protein